MHQNHERGLTLIEMLVVIGSLGMLAVVVSGLFIQAMNTYSAGQVTGLVVADIRYAMDNMAHRLREARRDSIVVNPAKDGVSLEVWDDGIKSFKTVAYSQAGENIRMDGQPLCNYVQTLRFDLNAHNRELVITITTVSSVPGARPGSGLPMTFTTRVALRNY